MVKALALVLFIAAAVRSASAGDLVNALERHWATLKHSTSDPGTFLVVEGRALRGYEESCASARAQDTLECILDVNKSLCAREREMVHEDCMAWVDALGSLYFHRHYMLDASARWQLKHARWETRVSTLQSIFERESRETERLFELTAAECPANSAPSCEVGRLLQFCGSYSRYTRTPASPCLAALFHAARIKTKQ